MRTRAQASRDAALRRMAAVNRSLAVATLLGTGVVTDVVANTASGHTRRTVVEHSPSTPRPELRTPHRHATAKRTTTRASAASSTPSAPAPSAPTPSAPTPSVSAVSSAPTVVAVSGGS